MNKSRFTTLSLQACNMALPIFLFIQLSTKDPSLAIKLEVFLALLSIFSTIAGFGAQSIIPQQLRSILKKSELLSYYFFRICTSIISTIGFLITSQFYGGFEFNLLNTSVFFMYFALDIGVLLIAFSAVNTLQAINLLRWTTLVIAVQMLDLNQSLMIFCGVSIMLNLYYLTKFRRFNKEYNSSTTILRRNFKNIALFNIYTVLYGFSFIRLTFYKKLLNRI